MFATTRERIHKNGKGFYERAIRLIDYNPDLQGAELKTVYYRPAGVAVECYCLERLWNVMFE